MMTAETPHEPEMGLTFEKVWAMFQDVAERFKETDRQFKETDRKFEETDRQFKETDRKIGKLGGRLGELVEHLVAPNILEKFNKLGYVFGKASLNVRFVDSQGGHLAEVDILLENGDTVLAVEVKSKLMIDDIRDHVARMEKLRQHADEHGDSRKLMGAVAGAIIPKESKAFAFKNGFYVIEQTGDTVAIDVPAGFIPREWQHI
jgi:hypothetical protein